MEELYYSNILDETFSAYQLLSLFGIDVDTMSIEILNQNGIYPIVTSNPPASNILYNNSFTYVISGTNAIQDWTYTPLPLADAKANASQYAKENSNSNATSLVSTSGVEIDIWTGAASQDPASRPPVYNTLLGAMADIGDSLATELAAIDACTSVDEINNIINPPSGIINTGRGSGLGPLDLNPSYYVEFNSVSCTKEETELYVPGTSTVIPYAPESLPPPYEFDSMGDCFAPGNYVVQIRIAATSEVLAEFICPDNPESENVSF